MIQRDLKAAGIPYEDASGRFFDFHSLRCELATLADQAGVSPRVVQKLMRHSSLELTGRYTKPRAVDIEAAASLLPSLKPEGDRPAILAATGTDPAPVSGPTATFPATLAIADASNSNAGKGYVETAEDPQTLAGGFLTGPDRTGLASGLRGTSPLLPRRFLMDLKQEGGDSSHESVGRVAALIRPRPAEAGGSRGKLQPFWDWNSISTDAG